MSENYLATSYNPEKRPFTNYPKKLVKHLIQKNDLKKKSKILDLCCGRGEFINEFINEEFDGYGVDIEDDCLKHFPKIKFSRTNISKEKLPYHDNFFDILFNKSVIEHFHYPENVIKECYRVLKPGGKIITLTPSWIHNQQSFFEDFTHRQPFTKESICELHEVYKFKEVKVNYFIQLPYLWKSNLMSKFLYLISLATRVLMPNFLKKKSKFIFFSKEVMLICTAKK